MLGCTQSGSVSSARQGRYGYLEIEVLMGEVKAGRDYSDRLRDADARAHHSIYIDNRNPEAKLSSSGSRVSTFQVVLGQRQPRLQRTYSRVRYLD